MLSSPLDSQYKLQFNIRPVKLAFFVLENDKTSLERVLRIVCTQWGGIRNLVISVCGDGSILSIFEAFLRVHEPDGFVAFIDDIDIRSKLSLSINKMFPQRHSSILYNPSFEKRDRVLHVLRAIDPNTLASNTLVTPSLTNETEDNLIELVLFGAIYDGQQGVYKEFFGDIQKVDISSKSMQFWEHQLLENPFSSPLNLTSFNNTTHQVASFIDSTHFDVVVANTNTEICCYWNLRATRDAAQIDRELGRRTFLLPKKFIEQADALSLFLEFVRNNNSHPHIYSGYDIRFCTYDEETYDRLSDILLSQYSSIIRKPRRNEKITVSWGSKPNKTPSKKHHRRKLVFTSGIPDLPPSYLEGIKPKSTVVANLKLGRNEVVFNTPSSFINRSSGLVSLDIESELWDRYPLSHNVAQSINQKGWFSRYGFSQMVTMYPGARSITFNAINELDALRLYFQDKGYQIHLGKISQYSNAFVNLVGGLDKVDLLTYKPVQVILDVLTIRNSKKIAQRIISELRLQQESEETLQAILDEIEVIPELKNTARTIGSITSDARIKPYREKILGLIEHLCQHQIIKRGFYLPCSNCGSPEWYPLRTLHEFLVCPGCSHEFMLPVRNEGGTEIQWQYRLNTLVNRAVDQDVLTGILAVHNLTRHISYSSVCFGLNLRKDGKDITDFDFFFVTEQTIYAGECKSGISLGDKDFSTALLAAQLGVAKFYFCTIKAFNKETLEKIETLKQDLQQQDYEMEINVLQENDLLHDPQ
jgi:hypothetical protein